MAHTFIANLNSDKIYAERINLADPVIYYCPISISNQSATQTIYFQATTTLANWTITSPTLGKLGAIGAGSSSIPVITLSRARPGSDTIDTGNIRIEGFSDSGYTVSLGYDDLACSGNFEDTEAWSTKTVYNFDDGTLMGWTGSGCGLTAANDKSIEVSGYSAKMAVSAQGSNGTATMSRSIDIPDKTKVRVTLYFCYYCVSGTGSGASCWFGYPRMLIDSTTVVNTLITESIARYGSVLKGWFKVTADLSAYKNTTKTLKFQWDWQVWSQYTSYFYVWADHIVIAGTD